MEIDLNINFSEISLGMALNPDRLADAKIGKMGIFSKAFMPAKKQAGDKLYCVKNPNISCFGEWVIATAIVDRSMGAEMMNGTSAYLFFNRSSLRYVIFQVIDNYIASIQFTNTFREVASELLGKAEKLNCMQISSTVTGITTREPFHLQYIWRSDDQYLISEIGQSGKNAFVHWQSE